MLQLRKTKPTDLPTLQHWDKQEHVIESDPNDGWNWEVELTREPDWRQQLIAEINEKPIGFIQIIDPAKEETHYWGDIEANKRAIDIWIGEQENLGKGYGTQMMQLALEICFADLEVNEVLIDPLESNTKAIRFYKKLGFVFKEKRQFGGDRCEVYSISKERWLSST
ncbi:MAG: GNAT family N-acetyltransferase [Chitinophagales bacterium]